MSERLHHGGCDFPIDPELDARQASVQWLPRDAPAVTPIVADLTPFGLSGATLAPPEKTIRDVDDLHWYHLDTQILFLSKDADLSDRPIGIVIPLDEHWSVRIATASRYRLLLSGRRPKPHLTRQRRLRICRALRTVDARRVGSSYRDIANVYFGRTRVASDPWKTSPLKAQIARLARDGRALVAQGYRQLLRGRNARLTRK